MGSSKAHWDHRCFVFFRPPDSRLTGQCLRPLFFKLVLALKHHCSVAAANMHFFIIFSPPGVETPVFLFIYLFFKKAKALSHTSASQPARQWVSEWVCVCCVITVHCWIKYTPWEKKKKNQGPSSASHTDTRHDDDDGGDDDDVNLHFKFTACAVTQSY